jgi:hypothetical protein
MASVATLARRVPANILCDYFDTAGILSGSEIDWSAGARIALRVRI